MDFIEPIEHTEFDQSLIDYNLTLSPEERLENHQRAFEILQELLKARTQLNEEFKQPPQDSP